MELAQQIGLYLAYRGVAEYGELDVDSDIFIDVLPEGSDKIAIYNRSGLNGDYKLGYRNIGIQILYKGDRSSITSFGKAKEIFDTLYGFEGYLLSNDILKWAQVHLEWIVADLPWGGWEAGGLNWVVGILSTQSQPEHLGIDKNGYHEYSINFTLEYKEE